MEEMKVFENPAFGKIRALMIEGEPWFVGRDVASVLGYKEAAKAIREHVDDEDKGVSEMDTPGGRQNAVIINESGLYSLILSSKLDSAKAFKRWVTAEVLPSIRKTGGYIHGAESMTDAELMAAALMVADRQLKERNARIAELEAQAKLDAPKVRYADAVAESEGGMLVREFAKILQQAGIEIGGNRLFEDLRQRGLLIKAEGRDRNKPTQYAMERGLFTVKEAAINMPLGVTITRTTPLITGKGRQYLLNLYLSEQAEESMGSALCESVGET